MWANKAWKVQQNKKQKSNNEIQQKFLFVVSLSSVLDPRCLHRKNWNRKEECRKLYVLLVKLLMQYNTALVFLHEKRKSR